MSKEIHYYWDEVSGIPGWYYYVVKDGNIVDDSQKIWTRVNTEKYGDDQKEDLVKDLEKAYPGYDLINMGDK